MWDVPLYTKGRGQRVTMDPDAHLAFCENQFQVNSKSAHERRNNTALLKKQGRVILRPCKSKLGVLSNRKEGKGAPTCGECGLSVQSSGGEHVALHGNSWYVVSEPRGCGSSPQRRQHRVAEPKTGEEWAQEEGKPDAGPRV